MKTGPQTEAADQVHAEKYRGAGESFGEAMDRVAGANQDSKEHYFITREILHDMRFLPAGRIQSASGSTRETTAGNCFVSGTIDDSFVDGTGSIMARATEAAATMRMGGGIGYDFSTLRPRGSLIRKLESNATGPVSFMDIFNSVGLATCSSGHRRGAQMGVLRVDHPDIEEFIHKKQNSTQLRGFNISVAVTDEFMMALYADEKFALRWNNQRFREVRARELWDMIMRSTWRWAEPGVLFIDAINRANNLRYCETIAATNPCGEQPLPPHGTCILGSWNLVRYLTKLSAGGGYGFAYDQLEEDIPAIVRMMDNVIDRSRYPLREQETESHSKRRMGMGVTGLANALEACGQPYGSPGFIEMQQRIMRLIANKSYQASALLAEEKGAFPLFRSELYGRGAFLETLDDETVAMVRDLGLRNSHLTSVAPTGTISYSADNVSSGIEPVFSYSHRRKINSAAGEREVTVRDYGVQFLGVSGKRADDCNLDDHLGVLAAAQECVDSAVSKTINVGSGVSWEEFSEIYTRAHSLGCKGVTTYRAAGDREGILESLDTTDVCTTDPVTGVRSCAD